jgi:CHAT domain-containing protein
MPTGLLGLFPLHAAGHPGQPGALDAVISSYAPTLRALAHTRQRPAATTRRQLTVALEHTPGLEDLRNAANEAADLRTHHPDSPSLVDQNATTGRVLAALPQATWAHFACHASTDFVIPSNGGLHLYDATLTLPDISRLQLTDAELAYLSACSTANRGIRHTDESINLASAFQLAGFKHVIATLWPLNDNIAATAARSFYRELPSSASADEASISVHNVITQLRTDYPDHPDLWAGMVHSGP